MDKKVQWYIYTKKANFECLSKKYNISSIVARIIINRNIKDEEFEEYLNPSRKSLGNINLMKDLKASIICLAEFLKENKKILIVGDYDIDGVCATYILYKALKQLSDFVYYEIPDRIKDGYGINEHIIDEAIDNDISLIITCDNGIAAFEAIKKAKEYNIKTIVTDHHDIRKDNGKEKLPEADFIVNPKQEACDYPNKNICGANVAYKFVQGLYIYLNKDMSIFEELFDFVAVATVGDVMPLKGENRYIVKEGLKKLNNAKNLGLRLLIEECNLENIKLNSFHIGYIIGPCLNAGGRLESAKTALELFSNTDKTVAMKMAKKLIDLNNERKNLTVQGTKKALDIVNERYEDDKVLVIYLEACHESLAGIIAGKVKEKYNKPCIIFTDTCGGFLKGSARSIEAYNIFEKLVEADKLLLKYGGHPMAAGLSIEKNNLDDFRKYLNNNSNLNDDSLICKIWIDLELPFKYINFTLIDELELLEPFGNSNEKPNFARRNVRILDSQILGKEKNVIKLLLEDEAIKISAIFFAADDISIKTLVKNNIIDIIYYPQINIYNNNKKIQLVIKEWKKR